MKGKTHFLSWQQYKEVAQSYGEDPFEFAQFGIDLGGGDSEDFVCVEDPPERKEK